MIAQRLLYGFTHRFKRGKVHHTRKRTLCFKYELKKVLIAAIALMKANGFTGYLLNTGKQGFIAGGKVINNYRFVTGVD